MALVVSRWALDMRIAGSLWQALLIALAMCGTILAGSMMVTFLVPFVLVAPGSLTMKRSTAN